MYNRYIPGANGVYECHSVPEPEHKQIQDATLKRSPSENRTDERPESNLVQCPKKQNQSMDLGDMLILCIILLLLIDCDQEDISSILVTAAAFLFLQ